MGTDQHQRIPFQPLVLDLSPTIRRVLTFIATGLLLSGHVCAQSVCLPAPRLLTTMPMGGPAGSEVEVTIAGDYLEDVEELRFSDSRISASKIAGNAAGNKFLVHIPDNTPSGIYEARVLTRLGLSSSRAFSVGTLPEVVRDQANTTLATAMELPINVICNASMSVRSIDHYRIGMQKGQRIIVDCGAQGIDSKLKPVVIIADAEGRDLMVERRGNALDFSASNAGDYIIKIHDLTFQGGPFYFYRLAIWEKHDDAPLTRLASTNSVYSFSWPPYGLDSPAAMKSPVSLDSVQQITLPCDVVDRFYPAADVDSYEFSGKKGDVWWIEVASQRLGLPTDPSLLVQRIVMKDGNETATDVLELADIPSPIKPSSNAYAYDGPPYDAGSTDILGKLEIKEDGLYRLQIRDLFGGTRNDPNNIYRLIIRKASPDFALVGWALHMELRNGDRNALSKPISLRGGGTMALEIAVVRRDGFAGPIELQMENLPDGVTATGLTIAAGQTRGIMLLTARDDAPRGLSSATFVGRAEIDGMEVERPCRLASMAWPVKDAWQEIPSPRLLADVPISVSGSEAAPLTVRAAEHKVWEAKQGESLTIPLVLIRRNEFSGASTKLKTFGAGFEGNPQFTLPLNQDASEVKLDLAKLKTPPGDYTIAFYGSAVAKYGHNPGAVILAESALKKIQASASAAATEAKRLNEIAKTVSADAQEAAQKAAAEATAKHMALEQEVAAAIKRVQSAKAAATPKDIVDILVSEPINIRVLPAEAK